MKGLALPLEKQIWKKKFRFFLAYYTPRPPMSVHQKFQPVLPAIGSIYIYTNVLFYYIDLNGETNLQVG